MATLTSEELTLQQHMDNYLEKNEGTLGTWKESLILRMTQQAQKQYKKQNKTKQISIRISEGDLTHIKSKAIKMGIPYQTLIWSHLRQLAQS